MRAASCARPEQKTAECSATLNQLVPAWMQAAQPVLRAMVDVLQASTPLQAAPHVVCGWARFCSSFSYQCYCSGPLCSYQAAVFLTWSHHGLRCSKVPLLGAHQLTREQGLQPHQYSAFTCMVNTPQLQATTLVRSSASAAGPSAAPSTEV